MGGFLKIERKFFESPMWLQGKPFQQAQAWLDLLYLADWEGPNVGVVSVPYKILMTRWSWDKNKLLRFLKRLELDQKVNRKRTKNATSIHILNYAEYQGKIPDQKPVEVKEPRRSDTYIYKDLRIKKKNKNISLLEKNLEEIPRDSFLTKDTEFYKLTERQAELAVKRYEKDGYSTDLLIKAIQVVDDWMVIGSKPAAVKARKNHTQAYLYATWVIEAANKLLRLAGKNQTPNTKTTFKSFAEQEADRIRELGEKIKREEAQS